jgi:putative membrane protein
MATAEGSTLTLASRRTGLAYQRTRLSAERTLMATLRTSLSLIGFGFGLVQFFRSMRGSGVFQHDVGTTSARNFGVTLLLFGVALLLLGVSYHVRFMRRLRRDRAELIQSDLLRGKQRFPVSLTLLAAIALLFLALAATIGVLLHAGPFG